jgi:LPS sulfotransferase NodH
MPSVDLRPLKLSLARSYVVCSNPRSGTTLLGTLIHSTGVLGCPGEFLRGDGGPGHPDYRPYPKDTEQQIRIMLEAGATPNGVRALKMFPEHFDSTPGSRWAERLPGLKYVQLIRRDLLGQAISLSIARQTDSYAQGMPERRPAKYSRAHIARCLDWLATGDARWALFFAQNGLAPLIITYEELCSDPQAIVSAIGRHVGIPDAKIGASVQVPRIQRDARSDEWRARFIAESRDLEVSLQGTSYAEHLWRPDDDDDG